MRLCFLAVLIVGLVLPSLAAAGGVGNPASLVGKGNYGITAEVENQKKEIEGDQTQSRRYLGRIIWGATERLDLYVKLGASDLRVHAGESPAFKGSDGMTYGGGATVRFYEILEPKIVCLFNVQGLTYYSRGNVSVPRSYDQDVWVDKYANRYKWNELQYSALAVWDRDLWRPYIGLTVTNVFGHVRKNMYRKTDEGFEFVKSASNDFSESAVPELLLGMDVAIGGTGRLSGELRIGGEDLSFTVGLSELYR
jgi:hypothetical protein